jgi:hypothetical protein
MKNAVETGRRLLGALEDFVQQESILLRAGHYAQMALVQRRAAPLFARLGELGAEPGVAVLRARVAALLERRRENLSGLAQRRAFLCAARERLAARRQRLQAVAPYRSSAGAARIKQLNAAV